MVNKTYGSIDNFGSVKENGLTGWDTIYGLIRALKVELGITALANNFGPGTQSCFASRYPKGINEEVLSQSPNSNVYSIIQGGLWCKGYAAVYGEYVIQEFNEQMKNICSGNEERYGNWRRLYRRFRDYDGSSLDETISFTF